MAAELSGALPDDFERLARTVLDAASEAGLSLATAESCTGGLLASLLTDIEGSSSAFERSFVVYSKPSKCELLGIAEAQIDRCGAVCREMAEAMATGAIAASRADIAVAITGFAGPAGRAGAGPLRLGATRRWRRAPLGAFRRCRPRSGAGRCAAVRAPAFPRSDRMNRHHDRASRGQRGERAAAAWLAS